MTEVQAEFTPEEEARIKWKDLLLGTTQVVVETAPVEEQIAEAEVKDTVVAPKVVAPEVEEDSPEAVLSQLYKSMLKGVKD